ANKTGYENQSKTYNYYLWNVTTQSIDQSSLGVLRGVNATFSAHYMWNDSTPIAGASLQIKSIDANLINSWKDNDDGTYDLIINTSQVEGKGSTPYTITFNISSQYNETQDYSVDLYIYNQTQLTLTYPAQSLNWDSEDFFNITLYYNNTDSGNSIAGANVEYNWGTGWLTSNWYDYGNGYYNITIQNWNVRQHSYGSINIQIRINKTYFENQTDIYSYYLWNVTTKSIDQESIGVIRDVNATFTVHYMWNDSTPIAGATLELKSIDANFIHSWKDNGDG
ncbi:unnamed protein product, partial [marine sediment metagenome]